MAVSDVRWYVLSAVTRPKACSLDPPSSMIPLEGGEEGGKGRREEKGEGRKGGRKVRYKEEGGKDSDPHLHKLPSHP